MNVLWHFYWPAIMAGFVIGILAGRHGYYKQESETPPPPKQGLRKYPILFGLLAAFVTGALWHGLWAGERYAGYQEQIVQSRLTQLEMTSVRGRIERGPMRRTMLLDGAADDFQRTELVKLMGRLPGLNSGRWLSPAEGRSAPLPLIAEAGIMALIGCLFGLLLPYLLELRRRSNAQWSW